MLNKQLGSLQEIRTSLERESKSIDQRHLVSLLQMIGITHDDSITGLLDASLVGLITR